MTVVAQNFLKPAPPADTKKIRLLAMTGCLGYGFTEVAFQRALDDGIDVIAADGGSMDPGPYYLGAGKAFVSPEALDRDLRIILKGGRAYGIPIIIGSAGGGGGEPHVDLTRAIIERIALEEKLSFRMAVIQSEPSREFILERLRAGRVAPLWPLPDLDEKTVEESTRIVAMMGAEPLQRAIEDGADVILAGRCSDSALFAAVPVMRGFDPALAWHMGKTIECGAVIIKPKTGQDCVIGTLLSDSFIVEPAHPDKRCTPETVAAHTMYENPSPFEFVEPSGVVDTRASTYKALDDRRVEVRGTKFAKSEKYTVKLEGVALAGYRAIVIAGIRDPVLISRLDTFVEQLHDRVKQQVSSIGISPDSYTLTVRRYGLDAVLGSRETERHQPHEVGLLLDVVAKTETQAAAILAKARYVALHTEFEGRMCTAGNLAFPFAPSDVAVGEAFRFSVWHTMELDDPLEIFPIEIVEIRN